MLKLAEICTNIEGILIVHTKQKLDQYIFIKLSHREYSGGGWASYIVGGDGKAGGVDEKLGGLTPLRKYEHVSVQLMLKITNLFHFFNRQCHSSRRSCIESCSCMKVVTKDLCFQVE